MPGPLGTPLNLPWIDNGTLSLQRSQAPGPMCRLKDSSGSGGPPYVDLPHAIKGAVSQVPELKYPLGVASLKFKYPLGIPWGSPWGSRL
jgi:hypothetical protein